MLNPIQGSVGIIEKFNGFIIVLNILKPVGFIFQRDNLRISEGNRRQLPVFIIGIRQNGIVAILIERFRNSSGLIIFLFAEIRIFHRVIIESAARAIISIAAGNKIRLRALFRPSENPLRFILKYKHVIGILYQVDDFSVPFLKRHTIILFVLQQALLQIQLISRCNEERIFVVVLFISITPVWL